jgi:hypothetical protein
MGFDGKLRREKCQFERRDLPILSPQFAVKLFLKTKIP